MKILGITAEYNPFHHGHGYHLQESMKRTLADCSVVVMSGNFTQRGQAAILDKWTRSRLAVDEGVDLVLELPFLFACNRAEIFARGAVDLLTSLGADWISFGSESGDLLELQKLAGQLRSREEELAEERMRIMREGNSFAKGLQLAVERVLGKESSRLMQDPNNILALEYLKRILYWQQKGKTVEPITVKRYGSGYFAYDQASGFAGASVIRQMVREAGKGACLEKDACSGKDLCSGEGRQQADWRKLVPPASADALSHAVDEKKLEERAFHLIRGEIVKSDPESLSRIYCLGEGLAYKLKKEIPTVSSLDQLVERLVSRRYTEAAIRRILVYLLLGVEAREEDFSLYGRVLAAGEKGRALMRGLKDQQSDGNTLQMITNVNKAFPHKQELPQTLAYDLLASDMYNLICDRDLYGFSDKVVKPYIKISNKR